MVEYHNDMIIQFATSSIDRTPTIRGQVLLSGPWISSGGRGPKKIRPQTIFVENIESSNLK